MFFGLDEHKALVDHVELAKKRYPQYKLPPVEVIEQEMAITDNCFYARAYGYGLAHADSAKKQVKPDPNLTYKQLLGSFKTIFHKYILTNEQI